MKQKQILTILSIIILFFLITDTNARPRYRARYRAKAKTKTNAYTVPRRAIEIRPTGGIIYAKNLYSKEIEDGTGRGGGLKIRTQVYGNFGYILSGSAYKIDVKDEESNDIVSIFGGGFYYSYNIGYGTLRFDLCYGAISTGEISDTVFLPAVEYRKKLTNRVAFVTEVGLPVVNDWVVKSEFTEKYTSFTLSCGLAYIF